MKLHHLIIVATVAIFVFPLESIAQERMFGNGRFLRRLRDDLTGRSFQPKPAPKPAYKKPKLANKKAPTPAVKPKAGAPTPARRPAGTVGSGVPTPASRTAPINSRTPRTPDLHAPTLAQPKTKIPPSIVSADKLPPMPTKSAEKPTINFGMFLQTRNDKLVVTQIDPKGNASKSGVKRGDVIKGTGGIDLTNMQEFNEITEVLSQGDQLEFVIDRGGKEKEMLIMFGKLADRKNEIAPAEPVDSKPLDFELDRKPVGQPVNSHNDNMRSVIQTSRNQPTSQYQPSQENNNIIEQQRAEIERMRLEIERLRQSQGGSESTTLKVPSLSGPGG